MVFTLIVNDLKPYAYEINAVLGVPNGSTFRARFKKKWISKGIKENPNSVIGIEGLYVVREMASDTLIPIRKIRCFAVQDVSDFFIIQYRIEEYIKYFDSANLNKNFIDEYNEKFRTLNGITQSVAKGAFSPLVLMSEVGLKSKEYIKKEELKYWGMVVDQIKEIEMYEGFPFVKVDFIDKKEEKVYDIYNSLISRKFKIGITHVVKGKRPYSSDPGETRISSDEYMSKGPYSVEIKAMNSSVRVSPSKKKISGEYDYIEFFCNANRVIKKESFAIEYLTPPVASNTFDSSLYLDLNFDFSWTKIFLDALFFGGFLLIYYISNFTFMFDGFLEDGEKIKKVLGDIAIIGAALAISSLYTDFKEMRKNE